MRLTKAVIHLERLHRNIALVRDKVGASRLICVPVKADAYGHGAVAVAQTALDAGAQYLAVATVAEGAELRNAGIGAPVLLLSLPAPEELGEMAACRLTPLVADAAFATFVADAAAKAGVQLPVHLKIDTGMGRIGCRPAEAASLAGFIASSRHLVLTGTATHLAASDSLADKDIRYTERQLDRFNDAIEMIRKVGVDPGIIHAAASGAVLLHENACFDMVRPGILLYGYAPSPGLAGRLPVQPLMELISGVSFIKLVRKGESVSYGRTWYAPEDTFVATIPAGYGDGLNRRLSGDHSLLIRGKRYPLIGRVCMDQCMVDLGRETSIERWETVIIFGSAPAFSAADIAEKLDTIPYEVTCTINKRVPRVFEKGLCQGMGTGDF
jgi:alanine racemase